MRRALIAGALLLAACGGRIVPRVQAAHGHEFRCDGRYVRVERLDRDRYVARGCGFEAEWRCVDGECVVEDSRAWGMGAP
ncbi:MAG: hypothetical protein H6719_03450 [Sandaracinaceae bacterium]|nr:hypothetical protein [Sandaracinaceae bacterium]